MTVLKIQIDTGTELLTYSGEMPETWSEATTTFWSVLCGLDHAGFVIDKCYLDQMIEAAWEVHLHYSDYKLASFREADRSRVIKRGPCSAHAYEEGE